MRHPAKFHEGTPRGPKVAARTSRQALRAVILLIAVLTLMSCSQAWSAPALQDSARQDAYLPESPSMIGLMLRIALTLFAIIFLIWIAVYLIRKTSVAKGLGLQFGGAGLIEVLERGYIAPKKAIYIVKVGGKVLALGVTDSSITTLADFTLEEAMTIYSAVSTSKGEAKGFVDVMKEITERFRMKK